MKKNLVINSTATGSILLFSLAALILLTAGADYLCFETVRSVRHAGIDFDSRSRDKVLATYKALGGDSSAEPLDILIRFKMKIYSIGDWNNVFQTAPGNAGIRMELSKPSTVGLVWGCNNDILEVYGCDNDKRMGGVVVHPLAELNKWHEVAILLDKHKRMKVLFNGETIYGETNNSLAIDLSDIAVGTGFNKTRKLDGAIKDFTIQYTFFQERTRVAPLIPPLRTIAAVIFVAFLVLWTLQHRAKITARRFRLRDFLHPVLMATFPVLFLLSANLNEATLPDIALPLAVSLSGAAVLVISGYFLLRDSAKAAMIATVMLTGFFSAGRFFEFLANAGIEMAAARYCAAAGIGIFILSGLIFFSKKDYSKVTPSLNIFSGILVSISILAIGSYYVKKNMFYKAPEQKIASASPATAGPDIYYIILDAYASSSVLKQYYSYDNSKLVRYLVKEGFYVASKSTSNYRATLLSIPSSLNMRYVNDLNPAAIPDLFNRNAVAEFLKTKGYKFIVLNLHGVISSFNGYADLHVDYGSFRPFVSLLLKTTLLFDFTDAIDNMDRNKTLAFFAKLPQIALMPGPKFVYAYVMSPHHPYLFGSNGEPVDKAMQQNILIGEKNAIANTRSYLNQLEFVNKKIRHTIDGILAVSRPKPVIILQSDHGPALYDTPDMAKGKIPGMDYLQARFGILNAYYLPGGGGAGLYDHITPVNSFRLVLNRYFQTNLPLLPDNNYYSPDSNLFSFTDVTGEVRVD